MARSGPITRWWAVACPSDGEAKAIGEKIYCIDLSIGARKTNSVMVMIIIHIAYITCIVTNDAWRAYDVIAVYKIHLRAGGISILRMAGPVMGEVGARNI